MDPLPWGENREQPRGSGLPMSNNAEAFEHWIRTSFVQMNTELEELYFAQDDRSRVTGVGDSIKHVLRDEGHTYVTALRAEGNTGEGFDSAFGVLGNVGMYLGALRRHELTNPAREERSPFPEASSLAVHCGASLGMAPRFATAHLTLYNRARAGLRKSFTSLKDEFLFIDENTRGILLLQRAADALTSIVHLGASSPAADVMLEAAKQSLGEVIHVNRRLMERLDVERFFHSVRPYYKPYRVGRQEYRGANAGDFSGINQLDLLLGLCRANDPYYGQLLVDKMLFMLPSDQSRLKDCMARKSLLDELLELREDHGATDWFQRNARAFLEVCDLFGRTAAQHHDELVRRFIEQPAARVGEAQSQGLTASGPPLPVLLRSLEVLRDLRVAADRPDIATRHDDLAILRAALRAP
jgi:Monodechloroaminopyrrolnitrin synthase PrnB